MEGTVKPGRIVLRVLGIIALTITVLLLALSLIFQFGGGAPSLFGYNIYLMKTDAFDLVKNGSAVITAQVLPEEIEPGNIVVFRDNDKKPLVGEVQKVTLTDAVFGYQLKNDAGALVDASQGQICGKALFYSEILGAVVGFATSPAGLATVAVIPSLVILLYELIRFIQKKRDDEFEPIKKQDEVPTYIPQKKVRPESAASGIVESAWDDQQKKAPSAAKNSPLFQLPVENKAEPVKKKPAMNMPKPAIEQPRRTGFIQMPRQPELESEIAEPPLVSPEPPKPEPEPAEETVKTYVPKNQTFSVKNQTTSALPQLDELLSSGEPEQEDDGYDVDELLKNLNSR